MTAELCHLGLIEIGCLLDANWLQTSAWASTAFPRRRCSGVGGGITALDPRRHSDWLVLTAAA